MITKYFKTLHINVVAVVVVFKKETLIFTRNLRRYNSEFNFIIQSGYDIVRLNNQFSVFSLLLPWISAIHSFVSKNECLNKF